MNKRFKTFTVKGVKYNCTDYDTYCSHHNVSVVEEESGNFIGEIVDAYTSDSNFIKKLERFVEENAF